MTEALAPVSDTAWATVLKTGTPSVVVPPLAAEHDTALELNANWLRLDLRDTHLRGALELGCKIAIDTDAHREAHFDNLIYGILTARRAGLEAASCINTWPVKKLHAWLRSKR